MREIMVDKSQTRSYEQLSEEEKKQVETKLSSLDYLNQISIIEFGSETIKEVTAVFAQIISSLEEDNFKGMQFLINNLLQDLQSIEPSELFEAKKEGILTKLPSIKKREEEKVVKLLTKQMLLRKGIEELEDKILDTKILFLEDMFFASRMTEKIFGYARNQEIEYITIQEAVKRVETEKQQLEELHKQYPNNEEYAYRISKMDTAIEKLKDKAQEFQTFRKLTLQSVNQLSFVQRADEIMILKMEDSISNITSLWKKSFAIALEVYFLNNAVIIDGIVKKEINVLLKQNIQILRNTILKYVTQQEKELVNVKTLQEAKKKLQLTYNDLKTVKEEIEKIRKESLKEVKQYASCIPTITNIK